MVMDVSIFSTWTAAVAWAAASCSAMCAGGVNINGDLGVDGDSDTGLVGLEPALSLGGGLGGTLGGFFVRRLPTRLSGDSGLRPFSGGGGTGGGTGMGAGVSLLMASSSTDDECDGVVVCVYARPAILCWGHVWAGCVTRSSYKSGMSPKSSDVHRPVLQQQRGGGLVWPLCPAAAAQLMLLLSCYPAACRCCPSAQSQIKAKRWPLTATGEIATYFAFPAGLCCHA